MTGLKPALCDERPGSPAVSAFYIAGRLGHREKAWPWLRRQLEAMIAAGFPPPIALYDCAPGAGATARGAKTAPAPVRRLRPSSRWQRAAVDAWFDGLPSAFVPRAIADAAAAALPALHANDLDARAAALAGGGA